MLEAVYFIFGVENYPAFQLMNVVAVMVMTGMLPLFLFTTFVYGDLIGWAYGICAIYYVIRYLKTDG